MTPEKRSPGRRAGDYAVAAKVALLNMILAAEEFKRTGKVPK